MFDNQDEQVASLSLQLVVELMKPIVRWAESDGNITPQETLIANVHAAAIMSCMCALELMFGEEVLRKYMNKAKEQAGPMLGGSRNVH